MSGAFDDVAAGSIEAGQEGPAVAQSLHGDVAEHQVRHAVGVGLERRVARPRKPGWPGSAQALVFIFGDRPTNAGTDGLVGPSSLDTHRAQGRPAPRRLRIVGSAGHALEGGVMPFGPDDRANDGQPVHAGSDPRQVFANVDAGNIRPDRLELAADLRRGIGLEIGPCPGAAAPPDKKIMMTALCDRPIPASASARKDLRERTVPPGASPPILRNGTPGCPVTQPLPPAKDRQHFPAPEARE